MLLHDDAEIGPYTVQQLLGTGGMGKVWLVRHRARGSLHALKVLHEHHQRFTPRLWTEAEAQAALNHPNVVRVTDTVALDGVNGIVMDYVDGPSLDGLLRLGPLSLGEIDLLGAGILRGVAAAHALGWVHRDLKPLNVLISAEGDALVPKVTDFGLARIADLTAGTTTGLGVGTRRYMPLEQMLGSPADRRMDVFALGAVLFELVEGRPAFADNAVWTSAITGGSYPSPSGGSDRMRRAIARSLAPNEDRVEDASALLALWRPDPGATFRAETVERVRRERDHLPPDRLLAPSPDEQAHLERCFRCRAALEGLAGVATTLAGTNPSGRSGARAQSRRNDVGEEQREQHDEHQVIELGLPGPPNSSRWKWVAGLGGLAVPAVVGLTLSIQSTMEPPNADTVESPSVDTAGSAPRGRRGRVHPELDGAVKVEGGDVLVIVALHDIVPGVVLSEEDLHAVQLPEYAVPAGVFLHPKHVLGRTVCEKIKRDEFVHPDRLSAPGANCPLSVDKMLAAALEALGW